MEGLNVRDGDCRSNTNGQCFYCRGTLGNAHDDNCVTLVRLNTYVATLKGFIIAKWQHKDPAFWDVGSCEFHKNDGSWCTDNALDNGEWLSGEDLFEKAHDTLGENECGCGLFEFKLIKMGDKVSLCEE